FSSLYTSPTNPHVNVTDSHATLSLYFVGFVLILPHGTPPRRVGRRWKAIEFFASECIPNPERRVSRCGHSELPCQRASMNLAPEDSPKCWKGLTGASLRSRNSTCRCSTSPKRSRNA